MCDCELPKEDFFSVTSQDGIRVAGAAGVRSHLNRTQVALLLSSSTIMLLSALSPLLVLPLVSAGVHKFKLQKLPPADGLIVCRTRRRGSYMYSGRDGINATAIVLSHLALVAVLLGARRTEV